MQPPPVPRPSRRRKAVSAALMLWGCSTRGVGAAPLQINTVQDEFELKEMGVVEMPRRVQSCDDINYLDQHDIATQGIREGFDDDFYQQFVTPARRRKLMGLQLGRAAEGMCEETNVQCFRVLYLNGFPGPNPYHSATNVTFDGIPIFKNVSRGWMLSNPMEYEYFNDVITVEVELEKKDLFSTHVMEEVSMWKHRPFNDEGFFTLYAALSNTYEKRWDEPGAPATSPPTLEPSPSPTPEPTILMNQPSSVPTPSPSAVPSPGPTGAPTSVPSPAPSASPSLKPTLHPTLAYLEPTPLPSPVPSPLPTPAEPLHKHPHLLMFGDGPYATMYKFNQTKMNDLVDSGTVVVFTSTVMNNFTKILNNDEKCVGMYNNWTMYNRTYIPDREFKSVICGPGYPRGNDTKIGSDRVVYANVSYMDVNLLYIPDTKLDHWSSGYLSVHGLPELLPSAAPTVVPTTPAPTVFSPTPDPTDPPASDPSPSDPSAPTSAPTSTHAPTTAYYESGNPCDLPELARAHYYFEPGRIWYVAVTGSPSEYALDRNPMYDYKIEIIDEFGGLTAYPTMAPTFSDTLVYLPSELITDPFGQSYQLVMTLSFGIMVIGMLVFVLTRVYFNYAEKRDTGRWLI